jgi:branched-chain amino acid transport system substrate-binding protein
MTKRIYAGTAALALVLAAAACGSKGTATSSGSSDTLVLGASLSLSGSLTEEGNLTKEGYEVCKNVVNAKGGVPVGDKKLKLDIRYQDDVSKPDTAAQLVDQFNDQGVKLILGPYGSATTEAAAAVVERNGQVMADSAGADDKIFQKGYKRTFAVLSPANEYASSILQSIYDLAKPRPLTVAFVSADDGFSKTVTQAGVAKAKALGFQVVGQEYVPNGTSDVSSALTKIKPKNPDVIIGSVHLVEGVAIVKQSAELGIHPKIFGETVAPPTPDFATSLGASAEGVLGSTQWTDKFTGNDAWFGSATDYATEFAKEHQGRAPEYHGAEATAACLALVLAVQKAGSTAPDQVREAMAGLDAQSFFGTIKFNPQGQNEYKPMGVIQIQGGKAVPVWPTDQAGAPMKFPGGRA